MKSEMVSPKLHNLSCQPQRALAPKSEAVDLSSVDQAQLGGDVPGDIPLNILWGLNSSPLKVQDKSAVTESASVAAPFCEPQVNEGSQSLTSLDVPGDIPMSVLWGLNKSAAAAPEAKTARAQNSTPWTSSPSSPAVLTSLSELDIPGDIPMSVLWK